MTARLFYLAAILAAIAVIAFATAHLATALATV